MEQTDLIRELKKWIEPEKRSFKKEGLIFFMLFDDFNEKFGKVSYKKEVLKEVDVDGDKVFQRIYWFDKFQCYVVAEGYYTSDQGYFFDELYISEPKEVKVIQWKKI